MQIDEVHQQELPSATAVLVLGILSLVGALCYGGGFILAIIALVLSSSSNKLYRQHPDRYTQASYKNLTTGRTCALIGLILGVVVFLCWLLLMAGIVAMGAFSLM